MESLEPRQMLAGDLVISELLASNDNDVRDEDRNRTDWIEILNTGTEAVDLGGYVLTDDAQDLGKWRFPDVLLEAGKRITVFASGKDRAVPGAELHTNFKLSATGEYLALVEPDAATVAFEYAPAYPPQLVDVSFGLPQAVSAVHLYTAGEPARILIPASDALGLDWTAVGFDDGGWIEGATGVGYSFRSEYDAVIQTNVRAAMKGVNPSAYVRLPFHVDDVGDLFSLTLSIRYNAGYVAFLNGVEVARANAPDDLVWKSRATARRTMDEALIPEAVDLTPFLDALNTGDNILAVQALNSEVNGSRFLMIPELTSSAAGDIQVDKHRYFAYPTAGNPNALGTSTAIVNVSHEPRVPRDHDALAIAGTVVSTAGDVAPVLLHYRAMFDPETTVPMFDDGLHGDGAAGDGVYGATIPSGIAAPGEMIRYRITAGETAEHFARAPVFAHPLDTAEYFGTVVADPAIQSDLPVLHLFLKDPEASERLGGTHGSLFCDGEFYDNIEIDPTGRTGRTAPKLAHDVFFSRDHRFQLRVGDEVFRMDDFDILTDYFNRSKLRIPLAFETWRKMGTPANLSLPVRVERNGEFHGTYSFIDGGNERFLERAGLDPQGALYRMNLGFTPLGSFKKMTRKYEDISDLQEFFAGFQQLEGPERTQFLLDNVNIPATVNFLVGLVITAHGDCCSKNLYLYRDTEGTGEWEPLPYDLDNSFGRGGALVDQFTPHNAGVNIKDRGAENDLFPALFQDVPGFVSMYLRRLRTLMDEFLQPPGTLADELKFEQRIDEMVEQMAPDAQMDYEKWGSWPTLPTGGSPTWEEQVRLLRNEYFPRRRVFLYGVDGDMDFSGTVDIDDIDDFVLGLADPAAYEAIYGVGPSLRGDTNFDTALDFDDIGRFVDLVNGATHHSGLVPAAQVGAPAIEFGEIDLDPISGNQDEEYIELTNPNAVAVDISGWQFTGGVDYTFAPGVVIPAGGTLYVSPNVNAFRARQTGPSGGKSLFVQGDYSGRISNLGETIELVATDGTAVATVTTPAEPSLVQTYLRISEIMYHPHDPAAGSAFGDDDDFEFVEVVNTSESATIDLWDVALTRGIEFTFPAASLGPGEHALVVSNAAAFVERYGVEPVVLGEYGAAPAYCRLSDGGESLGLVDADGIVIQQFTYRDNWYDSTDGDGYSLEVVNLSADLDVWGQKEGWLASVEIGGTPGRGRPRAALAVASVDVGGEPAAGAEGGLLGTPARLSVPKAARDSRLARSEEDNTRANEGQIMDGADAWSSRRQVARRRHGQERRRALAEDLAAVTDRDAFWALRVDEWLERERNGVSERGCLGSDVVRPQGVVFWGVAD